MTEDSGRVEGGDLELPRTDDGYIASITSRTAGGAVSWQALPPDGERDAWVSVTVDGHVVVANSWSGWQVHLSLSTGTEISRRFIK